VIVTFDLLLVMRLILSETRGRGKSGFRRREVGTYRILHRGGRMIGEVIICLYFKGRAAARVCRGAVTWRFGRGVLVLLGRERNAPGGKSD